jgi:hypothetical protein
MAMDLPFCKICGEHHRLGHCPEWDGPPLPPTLPPVRRDRASDHRETDPVPAPQDTPDETTNHQPPQSLEEKSPAAVAQIQRREIFPAAQKYLPLEGRRLTPEDMKQESLPPKQYFKRVGPRFDKRAYQRDQMRRRRAAKNGQPAVGNPR